MEKINSNPAFHSVKHHITAVLKSIWSTRGVNAWLKSWNSTRSLGLCRWAALKLIWVQSQTWKMNREMLMRLTWATLNEALPNRQFPPHWDHSWKTERGRDRETERERERETERERDRERKREREREREEGRVRQKAAKESNASFSNFRQWGSSVSRQNGVVNLH